MVITSLLDSSSTIRRSIHPHRSHHCRHTGRGGRVLVDSRLRVVGHAHQGVWALGDAAISQDRPLPPLAQAAQQVGWVGRGWTIYVVCGMV